MMDDRTAYLMNLVNSLHDPTVPTPGVPPQQGIPTPNPAALQPNSNPSPGIFAAPQTPQVPDTPVPHTGAFGVQGTPRSILGILGDAFLVQGGHAPVYQQKLQQERESDAMSGFVNNPLASIQKLSTVDPQGAQKLYGDYLTQTRMNRLADEQYGQTVINRALSMLNGANKDNYQGLKQTALNYASQRGVNLPFDLPDQYDPDAVRSALQSVISPEQKLQAEAMAGYRGDMLNYRYGTLDERHQFHQGELAQGGQRTAIMQQNANTSAGRLGEQARHDTVTEGQGDTRLQQGSRALDLHEQGRYYGTRRGLGAGNVPTFTGPNDPNYQKAAPGTQFRIPGDNTIHTKAGK